VPAGTGSGRKSTGSGSIVFPGFFQDFDHIFEKPAGKVIENAGKMLKKPDISR
jgi:hypothetical protein